MQTAMMAADLNDALAETYERNDWNQIKIYADKLVEESRVYQSAVINYPVLKRLVPSNESLDWPNVHKFNIAQLMNISFQHFNFETADLQNLQILITNSHYTIYTDADWSALYLQHKD